MTMKKVFVTVLVALFATVVFGQTKTAIKPMELPKCVTEWFKMNMKGFEVEKAFIFENKKDPKFVHFYYVRAAKANEHQWIRFEKDCRTFKKMSDAEANTDPPKPLPPVKQDPAQIENTPSPKK